MLVTGIFSFSHNVLKRLFLRSLKVWIMFMWCCSVFQGNVCFPMSKQWSEVREEMMTCRNHQSLDRNQPSWGSNQWPAVLKYQIFLSCHRLGYMLKQEGHDGPGSLTRVIFPTTEFYIFVPLVPTCDPQGGASFDSKGIIWIRLIKINKEMLNTKYQSSNPFSFREEEFWSWFS